MPVQKLNENQIKGVELLTEFCDLQKVRQLLTLKVFPTANFTKKELEELMLLIMAIEHMQLKC